MEKVEDRTGQVSKYGDGNGINNLMGQNIDNDEVGAYNQDTEGNGLGNRALFGFFKFHLVLSIDQYTGNGYIE